MNKCTPRAVGVLISSVKLLLSLFYQFAPTVFIYLINFETTKTKYSCRAHKTHTNTRQVSRLTNEKSRRIK